MKNQEQARLAEVAAEKAHYEVIQAQADIVGSFLCYYYIVVLEFLLLVWFDYSHYLKLLVCK